MKRKLSERAFELYEELFDGREENAPAIPFSDAEDMRDEIAALEPVRVEDRLPTKYDADEHGEVLWRRTEPRGGYGWGADSWDKLPVFKTKKLGTDGKVYYSEFEPPNQTDATHWMRCPPIDTPPEALDVTCAICDTVAHLPKVDLLTVGIEPLRGWTFDGNYWRCPNHDGDKVPETEPTP